jgi:hypothetical protein
MQDRIGIDKLPFSIVACLVCRREVIEPPNVKAGTVKTCAKGFQFGPSGFLSHFLGYHVADVKLLNDGFATDDANPFVSIDDC